MLFIHEVHQVVGSRHAEFEAAFRDEWMPLVGKADDSRLLWYCHHAHGTGPAYRVVTITAVRDGGAWERLTARVHEGDLRAWITKVDELRYRVEAKLLRPVPWSPLQDLDLGAVPTTATDHELSLYMEDTGWPSASLEAYIGFWDERYYRPMHARPQAGRLLEIEAAFQPAFGSGRRREAILWQKVLDHASLLGLLTREIPPEHQAAGSFMADALAYRDQWESRLLRTASWSPRW